MVKNDKTEIKKNWALVTGGSSGIGMELSKLLAKDGYSLIIVAKPQEELDRAKAWFDENMPKTKIVYKQMDLGVQGSAIQLYDFTTQNKYNIDILINNAGFGASGPHFELDMDRILEMLNLNVITNWQLTRLYVKDMMAKDHGKILITSSTAAFVPAVNSAAYSASKAFSYSYALAANHELIDKGSKVRITVLCPPVTHTGFAKAAGMENSKAYAKDSKMAYTADFVAAEAYKALMKGKRIVIPGRFMRTFVKVINPMSRTGRVVTLMKISAKQQ